MAVFISFKQIHVDTLSRGCTISMGRVGQTGWTQSRKMNMGNGQLLGFNQESEFGSNLIDVDVIDYQPT